jgi:diguanylate cyclase (GGDEF)-like protein
MERLRVGPLEPFKPELEGQYRRTQLLQQRTVIRVATAVALLLALLRLVQQGLVHALNPLLSSQFAVVIGVSAVLVWLAWSAAFEAQYGRWARVLVPLRSVIAAANFAISAARGDSAVLMLLPLMVIGPFFFLGFQVRMALISASLATAVFAATALVVHLPAALTLPSVGYLSIALVACTAAGWQLDRRFRAAFVEARNIVELARHDALTGTKNRRVFDEHLAQVWYTAAAEQRPIAVLLIDVDHFKGYNDSYGHVAGDKALQAVARTVQSFARRAPDVVARYGGEEFAAVLYDTAPSQARGIAEQMRRAVASLAIEHRESGAGTSVTVSIGIAAIHPQLNRDSRGSVQLADEALYQAKQKGRNRVELLDDEHYQSMITGVFRSAAAQVQGL